MDESGRRSKRRLRVVLDVKTITLGGAHRSTLLDLSTTGARLTQPEGLRVNDDAVLMWGDFEAFGTVSWVKDGQCGVIFDEPIPEGIVAATRLTDDAVQRLGPDGLTRLAASEWVRGESKFGSDD